MKTKKNKNGTLFYLLSPGQSKGQAEKQGLREQLHLVVSSGPKPGDPGKGAMAPALHPFLSAAAPCRQPHIGPQTPKEEGSSMQEQGVGQTPTMFDFPPHCAPRDLHPPSPAMSHPQQFIETELYFCHDV